MLISQNKNIFSTSFELLSFTRRFALRTPRAWQFLNTDILQGSVATCLRYGDVFKYDLVADLLLSMSLEEF